MTIPAVRVAMSLSDWRLTLDDVERDVREVAAVLRAVSSWPMSGFKLSLVALPPAPRAPVRTVRRIRSRIRTSKRTDLGKDGIRRRLEGVHDALNGRRILALLKGKHGVGEHKCAKGRDDGEDGCDASEVHVDDVY